MPEPRLDDLLPRPLAPGRVSPLGAIREELFAPRPVAAGPEPVPPVPVPPEPAPLPLGVGGDPFLVNAAAQMIQFPILLGADPGTTLQTGYALTANPTSPFATQIDEVGEGQPPGFPRIQFRRGPPSSHLDERQFRVGRAEVLELPQLDAPVEPHVGLVRNPHDMWVVPLAWLLFNRRGSWLNGPPELPSSPKSPSPPFPPDPTPPPWPPPCWLDATELLNRRAQTLDATALEEIDARLQKLYSDNPRCFLLALAAFVNQPKFGVETLLHNPNFGQALLLAFIAMMLVVWLVFEDFLPWASHGPCTWLDELARGGAGGILPTAVLDAIEVVCRRGEGAGFNGPRGRLARLAILWLSYKSASLRGAQFEDAADEVLALIEAMLGIR